MTNTPAGISIIMPASQMTSQDLSLLLKAPKAALHQPKWKMKGGSMGAPDHIQIQHISQWPGFSNQRVACSGPDGCRGEGVEHLNKS